MLYIISTPIGNLKDITLRALETLKEVDTVICEDSRRTGLLLNQFQVKKPLLVLNDFNEERQIPYILSNLQSGQSLALVSDAGTPLISDPGYKLVREAIKENIPVESLPGPSSVIDALVLSGLPPDKFIFLGYLPEKEGKRKTLLEDIKNIQQYLPATFISFIAPHKLIKALLDFEEVYPDLEIVLAHELTKIHQSVEKKPVKEWLEYFKLKVPKGEYVLLFNLS